MEGRERKGYAWAISAGITAALAAISAKLFTSQFVRFSMVILFNATMWGCYVNSLKALSSLQATVTNFATNFLSSGLAGFFLFEEALSFQNAKAVLMPKGEKKVPVQGNGLQVPCSS
ncbi:uncharacterized protein LOC122316681 isoform X4 [Carya illinoinensis]|uniref:Uncharacterized protein n=1 Tax=Carya illinoinensis TaxID=32201 RepID=A0A8T1PWE4_CARIL|nr:uncharacterized protein LOC122316681 isoform X4 [Carya illinoinensis]KAG6648526.1 hypothetical protein CIPAW_07G153100 [Carya illinoinensis]